MGIICTHREVVENVLGSISKDYSGYNNFLDMGCGLGDRTLIFKNGDREITGIDCINHHSKNYDNFMFLNRDIFSNGLSSESFDMIFSYDVIENLEKPEIFLSEIRRLLRAGGICVLSTPNKYRIFGAILILLGKRKFPYCLDERNKEKYPEYWHIKEYTEKELRKIVTENGFGIEKYYKVFYGFRKGLKYFFNLPFFHNHIVIMRKI